MWGFEASAHAFIQFSGTLASTRELIAEAGSRARLPVIVNVF